MPCSSSIRARITLIMSLYILGFVDNSNGSRKGSRIEERTGLVSFDG
jgi:hypothetical protein